MPVKGTVLLFKMLTIFFFSHKVRFLRYGHENITFSIFLPTPNDSICLKIKNTFCLKTKNLKANWQHFFFFFEHFQKCQFYDVSLGFLLYERISRKSHSVIFSLQKGQAFTEICISKLALGKQIKRSVRIKKGRSPK